VDPRSVEHAGCPAVGVATVFDRPQIRFGQHQLISVLRGATFSGCAFPYQLRLPVLAGSDQPLRWRRSQLSDLCTTVGAILPGPFVRSALRLTVTAECVLVTRSCGVPLRGLGSGFAAHGHPFSGAGLTWARQANGIRRSGPPSPALPLELLTDGTVVPTGPRLTYPGQSRGMKLCREPTSAVRQALPEHTEAHSNTPKRQQFTTPSAIEGDVALNAAA
jgi:hypothetical protein